MDTKITLLVTGLIVAVAATTIAMSVGPVYAPGASGFAPGLNPAAIAPGLIQSANPATQLGQECKTCGGGYWGSVPGWELKTPTTSPGP